jgi:hypothetical protein
VADVAGATAAGVGAAAGYLVAGDHEDHGHGRSLVWQVVDTVVLVALVVIGCIGIEWLYTELRARRAGARADLIAAQASVAHVTAANAAAPVEDLPEKG